MHKNKCIFENNHNINLDKTSVLMEKYKTQ